MSKNNLQQETKDQTQLWDTPENWKEWTHKEFEEVTEEGEHAIIEMLEESIELAPINKNEYTGKREYISYYDVTEFVKVFFPNYYYVLFPKYSSHIKYYIEAAHVA